MDPFAEDFDAFFSRISDSSSDTLGTSVKGDWPSIIPSAKGKLLDSSFGGSRGTPATHKRKLGSLTVSGDLMEGELDLVANKRISHLTDCFLHSSECISTDMAIEADRLDLNEHYSRALKACHDVSAFLFFFFIGDLLPYQQSLRL